MLPESLYSYLNLESTKTKGGAEAVENVLYSYLNLESTKTSFVVSTLRICCTVT